MTLSWPSFSAAETSAPMPPPAATEVAVAQLAALALPVLPPVLVLLALLELEELQPTVSSRLPATAALAAMAYLARKISLPNHSPRYGGPRRSILARQVEMMTSQGERRVTSPWRGGICCDPGW